MPLAPSPPPTAAAGPSARQRATSMTLVVLLHLLLLLLLLRLVSPMAPERGGAPAGRLTVFDVRQASPDATRGSKAKKRQTRQTASREVERPQPRVAPKPPPETPVPKASSIWSQVVPLTHQEMASVDSAMTAAHPAQQQSADAGASASAGTSQGITDDSDGPGAGPNGETLYNARWFREPTHAELDTYVPPGMRRSGYGIIACRTAARYHVEDCIEIGQTPGSGLAGAVRQAAWQFLVFPPRIGGKLMVGSWVRIRIDYTVKQGK